MFYEIKNIFSWIEKGKINNLFSEKRIPDVIITDKKNIAVALKYRWKEMTAPIIVDKSKDSYMKDIINMCSEKDIPVVEDSELTKELYTNIKTGQEIYVIYYNKVAKIYAKYTNTDKIYEKNEYKKDFNFEIQRNKKYETLSVDLPEKIQLELSYGIYNIIKQKKFVLEINGLSINNIKITEKNNLQSDEFIIRINGLIVNQGKIYYSNIEPFDQLKYHISTVLKKYIIELLGRDEIVYIINKLKQESPFLVDELMKDYSIGQIRKILHGLLRENVSIQNFNTILETIADYKTDEFKTDIKNTEIIIENIRTAIGRSICQPYLINNNLLKGICFDYEYEKIINNNTIDTKYGKIINEKYFKIIYKNIIDAINKLKEENITPIIIICSPGNRKMIKNITEKINEEVVVLSTSEIPNDIKIEYIYIMK